MPGLRFSQSTDLAIHGLWALAHLETGRFVLLSDIAHRQNVSKSYLAKVFQRLTHAGITRAMRGKRGGYALARPPEAIRSPRTETTDDSTLGSASGLCRRSGRRALACD